MKTEPLKLGYGNYLRFRDLVLKRSGLHFSEKKKVDLEAGILKALGASSLVSGNDGYDLDKYYDLLSNKNNPAGQAEMQRLVNILTIGETHFFRNQPQFNALANDVLPALIKHKRAAANAVGPGIQPQLRIWSSGCSTGEEPYSLAILLKELLPDIDNWQILILATDINQVSLERARQAAYSDWSFREPRAKTMRPRYFTWDPKIKRYRLQNDIKQMVDFASLNLIEDNYPAIYNNTVSMDLVLCRNVTIYFTETITRQVIKQLYDALVEGGWLVVGHSEPSLVVYRAFRTVTFPNALLYQKTSQPTPWPDNWASLTRNKKPEEQKQTSVQEALTRPLASLSSLVKDGEIITDSGDVSSHPVSPPTSAGSPLLRHIIPSPPDVDHYEIAQKLLNHGHTTEAIDALHRKLATDPDFAPAHSLLGKTYADLGLWAEAERWCRSALELDKLLAEPYHILSLVYQQTDKFDAAINMLKKIVYLERDAPLSHFNLATLYKETGHLKRAKRAYQNVAKLLEKRPPADVIPNSGGVTAKRLLETTQRLMNEL